MMLGGAKVVEKTYKVSCEEGERRLEDETYEEEVATVVVVLLWKKQMSARIKLQAPRKENVRNFELAPAGCAGGVPGSP